MKLRLVRTLSLTGVLAAATAVTVNSQLLGGPSAAASAVSSSTLSTTPSSGPVEVAASATAPIVASAPVPGSTTQVSYVAGNAATLILDTADGTLRLVDFAPHPGWVTVRLTQTTATQLEVRLESTSGPVRFAANFANGAVVTELDAPDTPGATVPGNTAPDNSAPGNTVPGADDHGGSGGGSDDPAGDNHGGSGGGSDDPAGDDHGGSGSGSDD
jgi:hypothetical protein